MDHWGLRKTINPECTLITRQHRQRVNNEAEVCVFFRIGTLIDNAYVCCSAPSLEFCENTTFNGFLVVNMTIKILRERPQDILIYMSWHQQTTPPEHKESQRDTKYQVRSYFSPPISALR